MMKILILCCSFLLLVYAAGCGSARKSQPLKGPLEMNETLTKGKTAFDKNCNTCHPGGDAGLGPALNNKDLVPNFLFRFQVRNGLGAMPSFDDEHLSDEELDAIVEYINALQDK